MILPQPKDALHKAWLYRLMTAIADDALLPRCLRFKGGTYLAMQSLLDRFSVDLDFDLVGDREQLPAVSQAFEKIFKRLGLAIKDKSSAVPQYFLRYPSKPGERNTIKIDALLPAPTANQYEAVRLVDIDRVFWCQTLGTIVANKLVAPLDRFEKTKAVAGRDMYDLHYFFLHGYSYEAAVIRERTGLEVVDYLEKLIDWIGQYVNQTVINQDINTLLGPEKFRQIRGVLKEEVMRMLQDEILRLG